MSGIPNYGYNPTSDPGFWNMVCELARIHGVTTNSILSLMGIDPICAPPEPKKHPADETFPGTLRLTCIKTINKKVIPGNRWRLFSQHARPGLTPSHTYLTGAIHEGALWVPDANGWCHAVCIANLGRITYSSSFAAHQDPTHVAKTWCTCGFYAFYDGVQEYARGGRYVPCVIEVAGRVSLYSLGAKAQKARVLGIALPGHPFWKWQLRRTYPNVKFYRSEAAMYRKLRPTTSSYMKDTFKIQTEHYYKPEHLYNQLISPIDPKRVNRDREALTLVGAYRLLWVALYSLYLMLMLLNHTVSKWADRNPIENFILAMTLGFLAFYPAYVSFAKGLRVLLNKITRKLFRSKKE